jgi:hypothetical protein
LARPVWSNDGNIIYGLSGSGQAGADGGHPAFWDLETGRYRLCKRDLPFFYGIQGSGNPNNSYEVVVQDIWKILVIDIAKCKTAKTLVDYSEHPGKYSMAGFSYNPLKNELIYGLVVYPDKDREYQIIHLDINTGKQMQIAEGKLTGSKN